MKRVASIILALAFVFGLFSIPSFAEDHEDSDSVDFTTSYSATYWTINRQYYPYSVTSPYTSKARTILNDVNSEYEEHYSYVCIYDVNNTSRANWSYTISNGKVDSGWAYTDAFHYAKRVVHYAEKAYDSYHFNTYRFTTY